MLKLQADFQLVSSITYFLTVSFDTWIELKKRHGIIPNRDIGSYQYAIMCRNRDGWIEIKHMNMIYSICK